MAHTPFVIVDSIVELTNGDPGLFELHDKVLMAMALDEVGERMLPRLQHFLEGKRKFACTTALREYRAILEAIGGVNERRRAEVKLSYRRTMRLSLLCSLLHSHTYMCIQMHACHTHTHTHTHTHMHARTLCIIHSLDDAFSEGSIGQCYRST